MDAIIFWFENLFFANGDLKAHEKFSHNCFWLKYLNESCRQKSQLFSATERIEA